MDPKNYHSLFLSGYNKYIYLGEFENKTMKSPEINLSRYNTNELSLELVDNNVVFKLFSW